MRPSYVFSLGLTLLCFANCRARDPVQQEEPTSENPAPETEIEPGSKTEEANAIPVGTIETSEISIDEPPIAMQPEVNQRVESLAFAHGTGLCVQVHPDGLTTLEACDPKANGQRFLFARSLDGRLQLKDTSSQLCLAVGPSGFFVTTLRGEVCESKSRQFFSVVDYGATYSLKFDYNNTCIDAEQGRAVPGTRLILYRCSAVLNQKIQLGKP